MDYSDTIVVDFNSVTISGDERPEVRFGGTSDNCRFLCPWTFEEETYRDAAAWALCVKILFEQRGSRVLVGSKTWWAMQDIDLNLSEIRELLPDVYEDAMRFSQKNDQGVVFT